MNAASLVLVQSQLCVLFAQGNGYLRDRVWRGVSDGCRGRLLSVHLYVCEERPRGESGRLQLVVHQHRDSGLPR